MIIKNTNEFLNNLRTFLKLSSDFFRQFSEFDKAKDKFFKSLNEDEISYLVNNPHFMKYVRLILALQYVEDPSVENIELLSDNIKLNLANIKK